MHYNVEPCGTDAHRKTDLTLNDTIKEDITQAANALESTQYEKSLHVEDSIGNHRSVMGVLMKRISLLDTKII
jgi:hypothetical protein